MTPDQFRRQIAKQEPAPLYLFLGPEMYFRRLCRDALVERFLAPEEREEGLARHDLDEVSLGEVIDDARSLSLFAPKRLIWATSAEAALPRGRAAAAGESDEAKDPGGATALAEYARDPAPGVVLVFDSARFDFEGEDKAKTERVRKFYGVISTVVEFRRPDEQEARLFAQERAQAAGLRLGGQELALLVDSTAGDPARLANEIQKLALYKAGAAVTAADIAALVPNAQETTIFALVNTVARGDRRASLQLLDTLIREGEYLPLALTFVGGLFRQALAVKEQSGLRSSRDVMSYFQRQGAAMWPSRAEQVYQTASRLSREKLEDALRRCLEADAGMKGARPDDRTVMEQFVLALTR
jgi:DNA polymerase-3 subunit delta